MIFGLSKVGKIHVFTDSHECICDMNIHFHKEVTGEYVRNTDKLCKNCQRVIKNAEKNGDKVI